MRFFYAGHIAEEGILQTLNKEEHEHLFTTLRARIGDVVGILDGYGGSAKAEIVEGKQLLIIQKSFQSPPKVRVHLFCAAPRKKELDLMLKQTVEAGVFSINLIACSRSVALPDGDAAERWKTIATEACKQSHNLYTPEIRGMKPLKEAVEMAREKEFISLFGAVTEKGSSPEFDKQGEYALFIGPEGGFTNEEEEFMSKNGVTPWNFSALTLRLETAAAGGVLLINYLAGKKL